MIKPSLQRVKSVLGSKGYVIYDTPTVLKEESTTSE